MSDKGSNLRFVPLDDSDLLSKANLELIDFIYRNKVIMVHEFIFMMDNNSFNSIPNIDTLNEARGLADLLKWRYENVPLVVDSYLDSIIVDYTYEIYGDQHTFLSVKDSNGKSVNIYSAITRLGFNDKERQIILNRKYSFFEGRLFIDVLSDVCCEVSSKGELSDFEMIFINKLKLIIDYYKKKNDFTDDFDNEDLIQIKLKELGSLMLRRNQLDDQIDVLKKSIIQLQTNRKWVKR